MISPDPIIFPLDSSETSLAQVGGKGRSLARLAAAGLPVPAGFFVSTRAYTDFVEAHRLQQSILSLAGEATPRNAASMDRASASIRSLFEAASMPGDLAAALSEAYDSLRTQDEKNPGVAVRSSATAEDLPNASFAGQQDSYLNVRGASALLDAVRRCWASLWTARAIGYRLQRGIDPQAVAMGVVVQLMVDAEVSGILFTANPATGERSELLINASFGLGESVVGGRVTPDTYVLDREGLEAREILIGAKEEMILCTGDGDQGTCTRPVPEARRSEASLSPDSLRDLATLCVRAEALFDGEAQDIEWAIADGTCWLLQSRPITQLPAPPLRVTWDPPARGKKLIRRQVVENMPGPLSPLFADLYLRQGLDQGMDEMLAQLGAPFGIGDFVERPFFVTVNGFGYARATYRLSPRLLWQIPRVLFWYAKTLPSVLKNLVPRWRDEAVPRYQATLNRWKAVDPAAASNEELLTGMRELVTADASYWFDVAMVLGAAKATDALLNLFLTSRAVPGELTSGTFLRGFPSRTLEAQQEIEAIARRIDVIPSLREEIVATPAGEILDLLEREPAGADALLQDVRQYLDTYGHQIYTLDFVQPTQGEDPLPVLLSLKALVENRSYDMPTRQGEMARARESQMRATSESLGPVRRWLFEKLLGWAQRYGPYREEALFYIGAAWPTLRRLALELGERLVAVGTFATAEDVFYLDGAELERASAACAPDRTPLAFAEEARARRDLRDARTRLHPPSLIPERERWKIGFIDLSMFETQKRNAKDSDSLKGFAVSPGKITGEATVVLSPADFPAMKPDTILVCPTTTPAWTPLFTQAAGLVTDIGGILAHGSIVAREYGIPAVMGTGSATKRIASGQRITVDGDAGTVTLVDPFQASSGRDR